MELVFVVSEFVSCGVFLLAMALAFFLRTVDVPAAVALSVRSLICASSSAMRCWLLVGQTVPQFGQTTLGLLPCSDGEGATSMFFYGLIERMDQD